MLDNVKISTKCAFGFGIVFVVGMALGLGAIQALNTSLEHVQDIGKRRMPSQYALEEMRAGLLHTASGFRGLVNRRMMEPGERQANYDEILSGNRQVAEARRLFESSPVAPAYERMWRDLLSSWELYQRLAQVAIDIEREKDAYLANGVKLDDARVTQSDDRAFDAMRRAKSLRLDIERNLDALVRTNDDDGKGAVQSAEAFAKRNVATVATLLSLGVVTLLGLGIGISRSVQKALTGLSKEAARLTEAAIAGRLTTRADLTAIPNEFRSIIQGVNDTLDAVTGPLTVAGDYVDKISHGSIPPKITASYNGDFNIIRNNLNQLIDSLNRFTDEMALVSKQHDAGDIDIKIAEDNFEGAYRVMAKGVNDMVFGHIAVKKKAMACLAEFAAGNFDAPLEKFPGKKAFINENIELLRKNSKALIADANMLAIAAVEGKLATRVEASRHQGDFKRIIQGVNETLDAVIGPLMVAAEYVDKISKGHIPERITDTYNGDFNTIKNNLNKCVDAVNALVSDADMLAKAAIAGKLSTRADASKHDGDFRKIVNGVNQTLDAVISPVMDATNALESLARYDMRARVNGNYQGDHARIKDALNGTATALQDALNQVADAVEQVAEASQQIAASSQAVSQGASEQASSLEETSSSLEEMAGMTKQNADNTIQARALAQTTKEAAEKGGQAMVRMTDAMEKIRAASEGTAEIIKDINDIAFQTNLLALNAAVEAARAGDAGRGFAVVAEEVRNLALRSKEAAKKTEDLIKVAVGHSENGRIITNEVAGNLTEIVTAAAKVNDIVGEIAVASQEQSRGIDQVNTAVAEMDRVVQNAAASAEESSSAAEELAGQSEELASLIQRFELDRNGRTARRQASPRETGSVRRGALRPATIPPPRRGASANRGKKPIGSNGTQPSPTPEEVIPLDNDPDFQDF